MRVKFYEILKDGELAFSEWRDMDILPHLGDHITDLHAEEYVVDRVNWIMEDEGCGNPTWHVKVLMFPTAAMSETVSEPPQDKVGSLLAEIGTVRSLLAQIPAENAIDRVSLRSRRDNLIDSLVLELSRDLP